MHCSSSHRLRILCLLLLTLWVSPAHAYLDPGTGSLIIQGIIGAIAAAGMTARLYWHRLRQFFGLENASSEEAKAEQGTAGAAEPESHKPAAKAD